MSLWFAFQNDGSDYYLNGLAESELAGTGAHGYATQAQADAHPNAPANPAQAALLAQFMIDASLPVGGGLQGVLKVVTSSGQISPTNNPATKAAASGLSNLLGIPAFTNLRAFMVRVAKVVIGGAMILVGLTMLAEKTNGVDASQVLKVASIS